MMQVLVSHSRIVFFEPWFYIPVFSQYIRSTLRIQLVIIANWKTANVR